MEIIPEQGVALVRIGDPRAERVGPPHHTVELVEIGYGGQGAEGSGAEAEFDRVQLTYRLLDDVAVPWRWLRRWRSRSARRR
ncbi:hypothetical protein ACWD25_15020 [Streptomyces sp. NPDC002920]